MRRAALGTGMLVLLFGLAGCVNTAKDVGLDFVDIFGLKIVAGKGSKIGISTDILISSKAHDLDSAPYNPMVKGFDTVYTGLNFGYYDYRKYGWKGRAFGIWQERGWEFLFPLDHDITPVDGNVYLFDSVYDYRDRDVYIPSGRSFEHMMSYPKSRFHHWGDIQVTAVPLFFGLELNLSPHEMADFMLGLLSFGHIDIADDDSRNYTPIGRRER
jgi:hypothetical protein